MRSSEHKSEASIRSCACRLSESKRHEISSTLSRALGDDIENSRDASDILQLNAQEVLENFSDDNMFVEADPPTVQPKLPLDQLPQPELPQPVLSLDQPLPQPQLPLDQPLPQPRLPLVEIPQNQPLQQLSISSK